jgi:hypothetical protein
MPKNAKRIRVQILNAPDGFKDHTSLEHARRFIKAGRAEWRGAAIQFIKAPRVEAHAAINLNIVFRIIQDSGQSGFLRYPIPHQGGMVRGLSGQYPVLAKHGAGML